MSIHVSKMDEQGKLEWLRAYERQNPAKYLAKYGKVKEKDFEGQPVAWDYISPEEAVKTLKRSNTFSSVLGVKVDVKEKDKVIVEQEFIEAPASVVAPEASKRGRKPKDV